MKFREDIYFIDWDLENKNQLQDAKELLNEKAVMESIWNILLCEPGQRPYNPEFGCPIKEYLFAPLDSTTLIGIHDAVYNAIKRFEPRITDLNVEVIPDEDNEDVIINVSFVIIGTEKPAKFKTSLKKIR